MNDLEMAAITDPGVVRSNNEDCVSTDLKNGIAVLADGMGGHKAGEVASNMAIEVISRHLTDFLTKRSEAEAGQVLEPKFLREAIQLANTAIYEVSKSRPDCAGMGSTVAVAFFYDDIICVGHVGDSRVYRLRGNELAQLTEDHSVVQELLSRGLITQEEAQTAYNKNLVTRALGIEDSVNPDVRERVFRESDLYLLCSDGLNDVLSDEMIGTLLLKYGHDLGMAANRMVQEVNNRGGPDNVSVILIRTGKEFERRTE